MNAARKLLRREVFAERVFDREEGRCAFCGARAVDAHHILERRLFADGGYYVDNGAAVCTVHHWECEMTTLSCEQVRDACRILVPVLPPGWNAFARWDKWGNRLLDNGQRIAGPLMHDEGARRALARGGVLHLVRPARGAEGEMK